VVLPQPTLDAVNEGRDSGIKEWEFQERAGMGQEVLWGSRSMENGAASYTNMEYGLSPPRRIKSRRNRQMVEKQVRTIATKKKIVSGGDWYISLAGHTLGSRRV
jgi:hypothetical protein